MTYERRKRFVLDHLFDGEYRLGLDIITASNGTLTRKTAYQTFNRMETENLIKSKGEYAERGWEREYRKLKPWENN